MVREGSRFSAVLTAGGQDYRYYSIAKLEGAHRLPFSLKVLLENVLRCAEDDAAAEVLANRILDAGWRA